MLADAFDRRRVALIAATVTFASTALLATLTWTGGETIWWLYVLSIVNSAANSVGMATRTAIVPPAAGPQGLSERAVRQLRQGSFEVVQLDATAYPGNSGGPVLDVETGEVVGVVSMVLVKGTKEAALSAPSGISYAVPVRDAAAMLADAELRQQP